FPTFLDGRTIGFYSGYSLSRAPLKAYQVKTDGSGLQEDIPAPTVIPGARIVPHFAITAARQQILLVTFPDERPVDSTFGYAVTELFLSHGTNLLQLTDFDRVDTGVALSVARDRLFFIASANLPPGENPAGICQIFSVNTHAGGLRQVTHLPPDGPSPHPR